MTESLTLAELKEQLQIPTLEITLDRSALVKYAGASDDYTYVHWDHPRMIEEGFPDVVVHGWLTFAYMCQAVTNWIPRQIADIERYAVRYRKPTFPGTIACGGHIARLRHEPDAFRVDLELWARGGDGGVTTTASMTLIGF
jgi:hydroxyacyl-ACP dehydratase HTD2-like protein with hotdog domain